MTREPTDRCDDAHPLARQLVELSALTGGLAHEIRNPLSTLKVNLQLLDEDWRRIEEADPPDAPGAFDERRAQDVARRGRRRIATLLEETQRLERILADFLQFVGKRELKLADADLNAIVTEMADFYAPQAQAHDITMDVHIAPQPLPARVDVHVLKQALLNLLINAQQAMPEGGRLSIRTALDDGDTVNDVNMARIDVQDSGPGVAPEEQAHVFRAYYSTKKAGTGLGLATAQRIVQEHGGTISLASRPGEGARFTIRLPTSAHRPPAAPAKGGPP